MATVKRRALSKLSKRKAVELGLVLGKIFQKYPLSKLWIDFDEEADVLYVSLQHPQRAKITQELDDEGILLNFRGKQLVGITVLDVTRKYG